MLILLAETDYEDVYQFLDEKFKIRIYYAEAYRKTQKKQRSEDE